jgi:hypothetical protein
MRSRAEEAEHAKVGRAPETTDLVELERARAERAHRVAVQRFPKAVDALVKLIGAPLVAYITGVSETRAVRQWITGDRSPHPSTRAKLQVTLQVAQYLAEAGEVGVIEAWFQGLNPSLRDQTPAELIRNAEGVEFPSLARQILAAAKEFANS